MGKLVGILGVLAILVACSSVADGDSIDLDEVASSGSVVKSSSSGNLSSSSQSESDSLTRDSTSRLDSMIVMVRIPASKLNRGGVVFDVDSFDISRTEVTQSLYESVMGTLPKMDKAGADLPVANVNWYDAVLFCNAISKIAGLDTAYVYEEVGDSRYLKNLTIDYSVEAVRLPTEAEWEVAYRAGTTTKYYWGKEVASEYAYYAQTSGPVKVGQYKANGYGLYDMGGNVAEWVNDWFGPRPTKPQTNYTGAREGSARVIRGGGWSDVVKVLAADSTVKKDPLYQSEKLGLRLVHSVGF